MKLDAKKVLTVFDRQKHPNDFENAGLVQGIEDGPFKRLGRCKAAICLGALTWAKISK